jgi:hypothetical protein
MILPNALYTGHLNANANTSRGLSPQLWQRASKCMLPPNGDPGFFVYDDFTKFAGVSTSGGAVTLPTASTTGIGGMDGYSVYLDDGASILPATGVAGGVATLATSATDEDLAVMRTGHLCEISRTADERAVTIFECRINLPTQVTSGSTFIGLCGNEIQADGGLVSGSGEVIATAEAIGFRTLDADPDGIDFIVKVDATTTVVINTLIDATALAYNKLGFVYDPAEVNAKKIAVYLNGVKQTTYVTDTVMATAASFPNSTFLSFAAAVKANGAVDRQMNVDWWALYQGSVDS